MPTAKANQFALTIFNAMISSITVFITSKRIILQCRAERLIAKAARCVIIRKCATGLSPRK
jgi:hypothetical protein